MKIPKEFLKSAKKYHYDTFLTQEMKIPHFYVEKNKVLSSFCCSGLEIFAKEYFKGVKIKMVVKKGVKLENLIAFHLLKFSHYLKNTEGYNAKVHYLRDVEGREVDFLFTIDKKPWFSVEVKLRADKISKHLSYFAERLNIPFYAFEPPHYSLPLQGQFELAKFITNYVGQVMIDNISSENSQEFYYPIYKSYAGLYIIPENLGYVDKASKSESIERRADGKRRYRI